MDIVPTDTIIWAWYSSVTICPIARTQFSWTVHLDIIISGMANNALEPIPGLNPKDPSIHPPTHKTDLVLSSPAHHPASPSVCIPADQIIYISIQTTVCATILPTWLLIHQSLWSHALASPQVWPTDKCRNIRKAWKSKDNFVIPQGEFYPRDSVRGWILSAGILFGGFWLGKLYGIPINE